MSLSTNNNLQKGDSNVLNDNKTNSESQTVLFSVYVLWCRVTDMHYVGVTSQPVFRRISDHKCGKGQFVDCEIQRIGWEHWDWWIIEEHVPSELISDCEKKWISLFDCVYPKGYNKTCGGITLFKHGEETKERMRQAQLGKHPSEESKEAMRQAHLGKTLSEEHKANISESMTGEKHPFFGKHHTSEAKEAIRQAHLGRHHSEETKSQMSVDRKGENHPMYGKKHTEESKAKMRQSHLGNSSRKGVPCSEETKTKIREKSLERDLSGEKNPFYGKHHTDEAKEKNRQAHFGKIPWNKGIPCSESTKAKIRKANRGKKRSEKTKALMREKARARAAAKRAAKAVAEENLIAANSTPTSLSTLNDAVILQKGLRA